MTRLGCGACLSGSGVQQCGRGGSEWLCLSDYLGDRLFGANGVKGMKWALRVYG